MDEATKITASRAMAHLLAVASLIVIAAVVFYVR